MPTTLRLSQVTHARREGLVLVSNNCFPCSYSEKYRILRQAYYYLNYALHSHKHRCDSADALTTLVVHQRQPKKKIGLLFLRELKRETISIRRTQEITGERHPGDALRIGAAGLLAVLVFQYERIAEFVLLLAESIRKRVIALMPQEHL